MKKIEDWETRYLISGICYTILGSVACALCVVAKESLLAAIWGVGIGLMLGFILFGLLEIHH
jgi:uncharacterized protein (DUF58 family)